MSKASQGIKLIKWLASQGDDVVASADDLKRFGPQAAQVRALLDFIPTMSDDAARTSSDAYRASRHHAAYDAARDALYAASDAASGGAAHDAVDAATLNFRSRAAHDANTFANNAAMTAALNNSYAALGGAARNAGATELISDLIDPNTYRTLTNPLAAGRAVDVLGSRPRNQGLPFYNVVRQMGERNAISSPRDVVVASRLAKSPKEILETALTLMSDGMSAEDAMRAARLL